MSKLYSIGEAAELLGVSIDTLRNWEKEGRIQSVRTSGGHRRFRAIDLGVVDTNSSKLTICYARVSSHDQKSDLERQALVLSNYCEQKDYTNYLVIKDLGSGLNYKKKGLKKLLNLLFDNKVERLIVTNKDRLLRFGSELIFSMCEHHAVEVVILNRREDSTYEEDLSRDVLEIITVFSARLYGSRSRKNQKILENLVKTVNENDNLD
ncbi:MAG: IS607 family transposase [Cyanobacteria bacterium P01_A01_bin.80]